MPKIWGWVFLVLFILAVFGGGIIVGRWSQRGAIVIRDAELRELRESSERERAELRNALADAQGRIDSIRTGLAEAGELALRNADRNQRIAILIEAIERVLFETRKTE